MGSDVSFWLEVVVERCKEYLGVELGSCCSVW